MVQNLHLVLDDHVLHYADLYIRDMIFKLSLSSLILISSCETGSLKTPWMVEKPRTFRVLQFVNAKKMKQFGSQLFFVFSPLFSRIHSNNAQ